jgi:hypothetical protein
MAHCFMSALTMVPWMASEMARHLVSNYQVGINDGSLDGFEDGLSLGVKLGIDDITASQLRPKLWIGFSAKALAGKKLRGQSPVKLFN